MRKSEAIIHLKKELAYLEKKEKALLEKCGPHFPRTTRAFDVKTIKALTLVIGLHDGEKKCAK